jgi:protein TonB
MVAQGGFYEPRKTNKTGIALVIAGHAAAIVAVLLAKGTIYIKQPDPPIVVRNIPTDKIPPEVVKSLPKPHDESRIPIIVPLVQPSKPEILNPTRPDPGPVVPVITDVGPVSTITPEPKFVQAIMDASAATRFQPDYPPALLRADIEGSATVRILIGTDGRVHQVEKVSATEPAFFDATERHALRYWRFKAATRDGVRVESWRTLTVRFKVES